MTNETEAVERRYDRALLGVLALVLLGAALGAPWHSAWTVDDRTYLERNRSRLTRMRSGAPGDGHAAGA